jgi:hypothetical protein
MTDSDERAARTRLAKLGVSNPDDQATVLAVLDGTAPDEDASAVLRRIFGDAGPSRDEQRWARVRAQG